MCVKGVLRGSVVKCLTRNPGVLGQDTSEPQPSTGETQEDMNNVNRRHDMTEILLKAA